MPTSQIVQNAFNQGEISPRALGRHDLDAYTQGARQVRNFICHPVGGLEKRPGTRFVTELDSLDLSRFVEFRFSDQQAYALLFRDRELLIFTLDGQVLAQSFAVASVNISAARNEFEVPSGHGLPDNYQPVRFTATSDTLPTGVSLGATYVLSKAPTFSFTGAEVSVGADTITLVGHDLEVNMGPFRISSTDRIPDGISSYLDYYVKSVSGDDITLSLTRGGATVNISDDGSGTHTMQPSPLYAMSTFRLRDTFGNLIGISDGGQGLHTITADEPIAVRVETPWLDTELSELDWAQSGDILYMVHPRHPPQRLLRFSNEGWLMERVDIQDGPYQPMNITAITLDPAQPSGVTAVVASSAIFSEADVGKLLRMGDDASILEWGWGIILGLGPTVFNQNNFDGGDFDTTDVGTVGNTITFSTDHDLETGDAIVFHKKVPTDTLPDPLVEGTTYYAIKIHRVIIAVATTYANALAGMAIDITTVGAPALAVFECVSSHIRLTSHSFINQDGPARLSSSTALPAGLSSGVDYFIEVLDADRIRFTLTPGGAFVPLEDRGTGAHSISLSSGLTDTVQVEVRRTFPTSAATVRWRIGEWGLDRGYPSVVAFHEQRLLMAATDAAPTTFWGSQSGDFENFAPDDAGTDAMNPLDRVVTDASALSFTLASGTADKIKWMRSAKALVAGTEPGFWQISSAGINEPITPTSINARHVSSVGSSRVRPIQAQDEIVYVCPCRQYVAASGFADTRDAFSAEIVNLLADHMASESAIVEMTYSQEPWRAIWLVRADGSLIAATYMQNQQVRAWHRHTIGGSYQGGPAQVETITSIPNSVEMYDRLWMVVKRTINGSEVRHVEYLTRRIEFDDTTEDVVFCDAHPEPYSGAPITTITGGLDHLEGETVKILADGATHPDKVVTGGQITLERSASHVVVGLSYTSLLETLRSGAEFTTSAGVSVTTFGTQARVVQAWADVVLSIGGRAGRSEATAAPFVYRESSDLMDSPSGLHEGFLEIPNFLGSDRQVKIFIVHDEPLPFFLRALVRRTEFTER